MKIVVVGLGYVGASLAALLSQSCDIAGVSFNNGTTNYVNFSN